MAVANHPLCEPVRFAHYKALVPIREVDGIVYVSGHGPEDINTYEPLYRGRVGTDLTLEDGYNAAAECAKTLLRAVQQRYGSLDCIHHLVRATALVNCGEGFTQPEKVADGFSDTCIKALGAKYPKKAPPQVDLAVHRHFGPVSVGGHSAVNQPPQGAVASSFIGAQCRVLGGFGSHFHLLFQCRYLTVTTGAPDGRAAPRGM